MAKITLKRRAELDAVRVLKVMTSNGVDLAEAVIQAIPLIQSKATEYTRSRRRRARAKALTELKKQKTPAKALEAVKRYRKKATKPRRLTEYEKHKRSFERKASREKKKQPIGTNARKLTAEEKQALKKYTGAQVFRGKATGKKYGRRWTTLYKKYEIPEDLDGKIADDLEYMTPAEIAKKYGLKEKIEETPDWDVFTDCTEKENERISYYRLRMSCPWISHAEYEDAESEGHQAGYFLYDNGFLENVSFFDLEKGNFSTLSEARAEFVSDYFGDAYIYVDNGAGRGRILLKSEYENAVTLAGDWVDSLRYIKG